MRLQKFLAEAGIASRRKAEEYISAGKVQVNGVTIREMGFLVNPEKDHIQYQGRPVTIQTKKIYIMLNKPAGCVSTCHDENGRKTVMQYVNHVDTRLYPVGRLDFMTEGLLLLTNDGEFANRMMHPRHNIPKKYLAVIDSAITEDEAAHLEKGVILDDGYRTAPAIFKILTSIPQRSEILCVIHEGKNRQLRRMFQAIGKNVRYLKRVGIADLKLGSLKKGEYRYLTEEEIQKLKKALFL
jgi:23S rRNA pseudouridine2605 synthase